MIQPQLTECVCNALLSTYVMTTQEGRKSVAVSTADYWRQVSHPIATTPHSRRYPAIVRVKFVAQASPALVALRKAVATIAESAFKDKAGFTAEWKEETSMDAKPVRVTPSLALCTTLAMRPRVANSPHTHTH